MTNLNEVEIVACAEAPNGEMQAITSLETAATNPGQVIATVPGSQDQWAEARVEAVNVTGSVGGADYCIRLQWGAGDAASASVVQLLARYQGLQTVIDGALMRGGTKIYASCLNSTASGAGVSGALNVAVRPFLLHTK